LSFLASVGLAIVVAAPGQSQAANLTSLVSFCTLTNCADGLGPGGGLIADADGNLFGTTGGGGAHGGGTVFEIAKTARGYASTPKILVRFCALANCADGQFPVGDLLADADGNLFGATDVGGAHGGGTVFKIAKTARGYGSTPTILVSFCALANCADGDVPLAGVIADADGNLFGTTDGGGAHNGGTVFEIAKTARGYASTPTILVSFCALTNWDDGLTPDGSLIADADGNLFGATANGGRTAKVRCSRSPAAASSRPPHGSPGRLGRQTVTARASRRSPRSMAGSTMPPQRSATPVSRF
jgi:uncharacterized repeat protein (TIGR03803 family)